MYLNHFGFKDKPFKLAHDSQFYYPAAHQLPLNELLYSIEERQGLATLIGEPGTGKTTLLRRLVQCLGHRHQSILLTDAHLGGNSIFRRLEASVGAPVATHHTGSEKLRQILSRNRRTVVLLLDEAQNLTPSQLEEVHYLTNLEAPGRKLVEIIMTGQPSLAAKLATPELEALRQRTIVRCKLKPFDFKYTHGYIQHRLMVAGANDLSVFSPGALQLIYQHSRGVPRLINIICERCLIVAYVEETHTIDEALVEESVADLNWDKDKGHQSTPAHDMGNSLLLRMGSRIEAIERKLDVLVQLLSRAGLVRPELADTVGARRWVEDLKRGTPGGTGNRHSEARKVS
jgi:general secretion pathway protein A